MWYSKRARRFSAMLDMDDVRAEGRLLQSGDSMKLVKKSVLLQYTAQEMYDLVTAVEDYPKFLPWCESARIVETHPDGVTARLGLSYMGVRHAFTTRNRQQPAKAVHIELVDGPFSLLGGTWLFKTLGFADKPAQACRIDFEMRYAFASLSLEAVVSPVFDRIANTFVDSFVARAEAVYGRR
jgi:ribosome-associated toxin RatA of RatAB toxin-antitoxin module